MGFALGPWAHGQGLLGLAPGRMGPCGIYVEIPGAPYVEVMRPYYPLVCPRPSQSSYTHRCRYFLLVHQTQRVALHCLPHLGFTRGERSDPQFDNVVQSLRARWASYAVHHGCSVEEC